MNKERLMNIILSPRVSEKTSTRADIDNQHVFSIHLSDHLKYAILKVFA